MLLSRLSRYAKLGKSSPFFVPPLIRPLNAEDALRTGPGCRKIERMIGTLAMMAVPRAEGGTPDTGTRTETTGHLPNDLDLPDVPRSGRWGDWVYYLRGNKQCRRRYVLPTDPRTPGQLRSRAAFGAASKAWSESCQLTEEDRRSWRAAGAKVQSRVRLGQSGPLTGQQHYVGRNCAKDRTGLEMLARPKDDCGVRPLPVPPSSFFILPSSFIHRPRPISGAYPAQPQPSPHVDRLCPGRTQRSRVSISRPELRTPAPQLRRFASVCARPCLCSPNERAPRPQIRWPGRRRDRWRGG
jgi:hypothetical protein